MTHWICRHKVEDFDRWYEVFKRDATAQTKAGIRTMYVMRDAEDPNTVVMWFEVASREAARAFTGTPAAAEAGEEAGVVGELESWFLEESLGDG